MKFIYEYRSSDNEKHWGEIKAANRDAVFSALKIRGIRPSRVVEAPGFFNKLLGKGKRWMTIAVLSAIVLLSVSFWWWFGLGFRETRSILFNTTRRQIVGDSAVVEKGVRTGWADVFDLEGDRFFASFAIPGVPAGQRSTTEAEIFRVLNEPCPRSREDSFEVLQIKAMVEGMKEEARSFLAAGGSVHQYGVRLVERQEAELAIYNKAKRELEEMMKHGMERTELERLWERRNEELRKMGIRLVPFPE